MNELPAIIIPCHGSFVQILRHCAWQQTETVGLGDARRLAQAWGALNRQVDP